MKKAMLGLLLAGCIPEPTWELYCQTRTCIGTDAGDGALGSDAPDGALISSPDAMPMVSRVETAWTFSQGAENDAVDCGTYSNAYVRLKVKDKTSGEFREVGYWPCRNKWGIVGPMEEGDYSVRVVVTVSNGATVYDTGVMTVSVAGVTTWVFSLHG